MFFVRSHLSSSAVPIQRDPSNTVMPADMAEVADALSRALLHGGTRRVHDADLIIGRVTAAVLIQHLLAAGFVIVRQDPSSVSGGSSVPEPGH